MAVSRYVSVLVVSCALGLANSAAALSAPLFDTRTIATMDRKVFLFGGRLSEDYIEYNLHPFNVTYEDNYLLGGGYQQFMLEPLPFVRLGTEIGAAARFGVDGLTGELWGGVVTRFDGFAFDGGVRISPSVTLGMSLVTDTMGVEAEREAVYGRSGRMLFYFSPEISISLTDNPEAELFWRLQHRSAGYGTIGGGSANATTIGYRFSF